LKRSIKPHYAHGEHALHSDIVSVRGLLQELTDIVMYQGILIGLEQTKADLDNTIGEQNAAQYYGMLTTVQKVYDNKAKVHDMFIGNNRLGLVH
jgi:hypothetical protein